MTTYYKATRPDGTDFYSGTVDYAAALASGEVIRHAGTRERNRPSTYLSVSVEPADCTGFAWPCRLFRVEPVGRVMANLLASPNKRAVSALRVVEELPAWQALGPNGEAVAAFVERLRTATPEKIRTAWDAAWDAAWGAAWDAAWDAARDAAWGAAWEAARAAARDAAGDAAWAAAGAAAGDAAWAAAGAAAGDAAWAIVLRDKISAEQYAILVRPFIDAGLGEWVA